MPAGLINGRYEWVRALGTGASATVHLVRDHAAAGVERALKLVSRPAAQHELAWEFARLSQLEHPHLVRVHDLDRVRSGPATPGGVFLVEDFVDGRPCVAALAGLDPAERPAAAVRLLAEAASALGYLHARGLLHRDVSPTNLMVDRTGAARLVDLGLGAAAGIAGTPGYLAPEALVGGGSARSDLYALGATVWHAATTRPPHVGEGAALLRTVLEQDPILPPELPEPLGRILVRLLARDPAERHASAAELHADLARLLDLNLPVPDPPRGEAASGLLVGRERELAHLWEIVQALASGRPAPSVVLVQGEEGSGRSRLCAEALRRLRLEAAAGRVPPIEVLRGRVPEVASQLGLEVPADGDDRARSRESRDVRLLAALAARAPVIVHLAEAGEAELALAARAAPGEPGTLLLVETAQDQRVDRAEVLVLLPLGEGEVTRLCAAELGHSPDPGFVRRVAQAAGGLPLGVRELCRAAGATGDRADVATLSGDGLSRLAAARLASAPPASRRVAATLAALGRPAAPGELLALAEAPADALATLVQRGLCEPGPTLSLLSAAHVEAALEGADAPLLARVLLHVRSPAWRARLLARLGRDEDAAAADHEAGLAALGALDLGAAAPHLERALAAGREDARLPLAQALADRGDYAGALRRLEPLPDADPAVIRLRARALARGGDPAAAEASLRQALGAASGADLAAELRELLGRLLIARGAFAEARALQAGPEVEGLAALYQGDHRHADACFQAAEAAAADGRARARVTLLLGNAAHVRGQYAQAAAWFGRALAHAQKIGDVHVAAPAAGSLGAALKELGELGAALAPMRQAVRDLGRLGQTAWLGAALANLGALLVALGDLAAAEMVIERARAEALGRKTPLLEAVAALTEGELHRRRGRPDAARTTFSHAEQIFEGLGETAYRNAARRGGALALGDAGNLDDALALLATLPADPDRDLARARLLLARGAAEAAREPAQAARDAFSAAGRAGESWRAELVVSRVLGRLGRAEEARAALGRARQGFQEIRMKTPELYQKGLDDDADARLLSRILPEAPVVATPAGAPLAEARLRRLLLVNKRLNSELRVGRLLELIVDTVIEFTDAERGFLLLADKQGELGVRLARNIDQRTLAASEFALSRSIAERAAREGQPIVTIDAQGDERFSSALSVADLRLRSVLVVPLSVKGRVSGAIYVDHRLRRGAFGEDAVQLVLDFADQAAIALENARLLRELRRARKRAEQLAADLAARVDRQQDEIRDMKVELTSSREALAVRYDYQNLIGRTPRMIDLFRLLDRVTETDLPVVIHGESGTGKELAARAIHHNGRRRDRPFVSENCGAIPETLLESTLFGYVRGAFTGADRDARGLFEIADGGTLFLDEVSEMSPAMQTKLLRVLQEGEFRRVGGERPQRVDVRIIAASNRDLRKQVEEGRFREDLFYRLNVVAVEMPPLRERREDIPLLVEHFLALRKEGAPARQVSPEAMACLMRYAWPGNVRELENEILRTAALGGEVIGPRDLSSRVAAGETTEPPPASDDLRLRRRVEALERALVRSALEQAGGNQTRAARLLGLSRFGLQKKLKRYRIK
jgi:transcriptional regulator with GAF, ATPase, and Fis domain/tetratricopeptide (TPR) repeat protein